MTVGGKIRLATSPLTRHLGLRGTGTVTAVKLTDPVNRRYLVIVATKAGYVHLTDVAA